MEKVKGDNLVFWGIAIAVVILVALIFYFKSDSADDETLKCIANNSKLYVLKTCSHCADQKQILGSGLKYFELIDCGDFPEKCIGISGVPAWEINGERSSGVKSISELKELTGC